LSSAGFLAKVAILGAGVMGVQIATLKAVRVNMKVGRFIFQHDYNAGCCIVETLCGGDVDAGSRVDE
jgi:3-hydroxyacyl-CoA dehydrogenase